MTAKIIGHAPCPECGDNQSVKFDSKKYFISCTSCRTFTSYQSKEAKGRIKNRLTPLPEREEAEASAIEDQPESTEGTPKIKTNGKPYKPVETQSFIDALAEWL